MLPRERSGRNERLPPHPLAHRGLALQREGALGARLQGRRAPAPRSAPRRPHRGRPLAHPRRARRPSRSSRSTGATSAARARSSPPSSGASRTRRSIPADPEQRRRALELEGFFDEELAPHVRHLAFHEMRDDPERMQEIAEDGGARRSRSHGRRLRPRLHAACAGSPATRRRRRPTAPRSSPPSTASSGSSARATTWSAKRSASPTSPPRPCFTRSSSPPRGPRAKRGSRRG